MNKRRKKYIIVFVCLWIPSLISLLFAFVYPPLMIHVYSAIIPEKIDYIIEGSYPTHSSIIGLVVVFPVFIMIILLIVYIERKGCEL